MLYFLNQHRLTLSFKSVKNTFYCSTVKVRCHSVVIQQAERFISYQIQILDTSYPIYNRYILTRVPWNIIGWGQYAMPPRCLKFNLTFVKHPCNCIGKCKQLCLDVAFCYIRFPNLTWRLSLTNAYLNRISIVKLHREF